MKNDDVEKHDILIEADITVLNYAFYTKVRNDKLLLFALFDPIVKDNWEHHLERMTDFWSTLLLYTRKFKDDPLSRHLPLPINITHFDRWLQLFNKTVDELFEGQVAENAKKKPVVLSG